MLVLGVNPHRKLDEDYVASPSYLAGQIGAGLSGAGAYESERARAEGLAELATLREAAAEALARLNESLARGVAARTTERDRMRDMFQQGAGLHVHAARRGSGLRTGQRFLSPAGRSS